MSIQEIVSLLNQNQGVLAAIPIIGGIIFWFVRLRKKDTKDNNSPYISAGHNVTVGGDISVGNHNTRQTIIQKADDIPEIHLQLYGSGANKTIEGHVEKKVIKL